MAERTLIGWNAPNLITVPAMALIAFLVFATFWQIIKTYVGGGETNIGSTGY